MENRYEWKTVAAEVKQQVTQNMAEQNRQMNYHITEQQRDVLEQRLEKLNEKYKGKPMPAEAKELKDDLQKRLDKKEKELKSLEKK